MIRLLIFDMCGISTLLLPGLLGKLLGTDGIFAILSGAVPVYFFTFLFDNKQGRQRNSYPEILKKQRKRGSNFLLILYAVEGILVAGYGLFLLSDVMIRELLKDGSFFMTAVLLALLCGYGIWQGIEGRARVYEILFWFAFVPLIIMLLLASKDVNTIYWTPVWTHSLKNFLVGTAAVILLYGTLAFVLFLRPYLASGVRVGKVCRISLCVTVLLNAVIYLITLGIFGSGMLPKMKYPVITLMSMIKLPGGFFERQDAFMVAIWFFTLYAFINTGMFYASDLGKEVWQNCKNSKGAKEKRKDSGEDKVEKKDSGKENKGVILLVMLLTLAVTWLFYQMPEWKHIFVWIQAAVFLPLVLILPVCIRRAAGRSQIGK